ncbi:MAG: nucleoside phosphorylase [Cyclobacteriaceae bacterium]|jgi:uridine phosphorylase|nr:nucleoside phosphorylase [Cyclobacteriaceae bacterium]
MASFTETDLILNPDGSVYHLNLKPEHIAENVIVVGDPGRVFKVSSHFDKIEFEINKREFITHTGWYRDKRITVLSTGIGTDNVEICMTELDALVNVDLTKREVKPDRRSLNIIRIGTSGALQEDIPVGAHLATEYAVGMDNLMEFYDFPMDAFEVSIAEDIRQKVELPFRPYVVKGSSELLQRIGEGMITGNTLTSPGFYAPQGRSVRAQVRFPRLLDDLTAYHDATSQFWLTNFEMETSALYSLGRMLGHRMLSTNAIIANRARKKFAKNSEKAVEDLIVHVLERL